MTDSTIIYTHTDEAPALATYSFLPVVGGGGRRGRGGGGARARRAR
ncbi:NADP-dependent isocitrate dehydrogenase, partial [Streptomyces sp. NPDC059122]